MKLIFRKLHCLSVFLSHIVKSLGQTSSRFLVWRQYFSTSILGLLWAIVSFWSWMSNGTRKISSLVPRHELSSHRGLCSCGFCTRGIWNWRWSFSSCRSCLPNYSIDELWWGVLPRKSISIWSWETRWILFFSVLLSVGSIMLCNNRLALLRCAEQIGAWMLLGQADKSVKTEWWLG